MPRPIPPSFVDQDTYGVVAGADARNVRTLQVPADYKVGLTDLFIGRELLPISLAMAGLITATDPEDVAKLVLGAILAASGTPATSARISTSSMFDAGGYKKLADWVRREIFRIDDSGDAIPDAADANSDTPIPRPGDDCLPGWYRGLDVNLNTLRDTFEIDDVEKVAYAGILGFAVGKEPTAENLSAFNARRRNAVRSFLTADELTLFVDDSPFLSLEILTKVHRCMNSFIEDRAAVMSAVIANDRALISGNPRVFYTLFRLSAGSSLNPIFIIAKFARKYRALYAELPELETEYWAAHKAIEKFTSINERERLYQKVIFGSAYVPVERGDIQNLLGVAAFALSKTEENYENYKGGVLSEKHREVINTVLGSANEATAEEDVEA